MKGSRLKDLTRSEYMATSVKRAKKPSPRKASAWDALATHYKVVSKRHLRQLFADDPKRSERLTLQAAGLYFDYSKNRVTDETLRLLTQLATQAGLAGRIQAMFRGDK